LGGVRGVEGVVEVPLPHRAGAVAAVRAGVGAERRVGAVDVAVRAGVQRDGEPADGKLPARTRAVERRRLPDGQ
jgi:hypothetical protein